MNIFTRSEMNGLARFSANDLKKFLSRIALMLSLFVLVNAQGWGQTTVTYAQRIAHYNAGTVFTVGTAGAFNQGTSQVGMYANGGTTKQVVAWRTLKTAGDNTGSNRSLQVGDEFRISVSANTVVGEMGFALLSSPSSRSSWNDRLNNAAVSVRLSNYGNWYATYSDGTTANASTSTGSNNIGGTTSYRNFVFTCLLTAPNRMNITITDGTTTSNLNDVLLNNSNAITEYSIFLSDDWNGVQHRDIYWNTNSAAASDFVRNTLTMPIGGSNGSFTISGVLPNGLAANSTSTASVNALTKSGSGSLTLSGNNTYTGTTTISAGTLLLGAAGSGSNTPLGTTAGATTVSSGGALNLNGFTLATAEGLTINGTGISSEGALMNSSGTGSTWTGTVALGSDASVGGSGSITLNGAISGGNSLTKIGAGTLTLGATNSFGGASKTFTIQAGTVAITSFTNNLGSASNTIVLGTASTSGTLDFTPGTGNVNRTFTVAAGGGTFKSNGSGVPTFAHGAGANTITLNGNLTLNCAGTGNMEFNCGISGAGGIIVNSSSTGRVLMQPASAGTSTYTGATTISSGSLYLRGANLISNSSNLILNGGLFGTGETTGYSETLGTLQVTANSTIALGTSSHTLSFSASSAAAWTTGATLTITGWSGTAGATGSAGKIFVGSDATGLDATQLEAITFDGYGSGATILSTGEVVPTAVVTIMSTTTGGNWNATGTWVGGVVPGLTDNVRIQPGATVTVTANASCKQLEMAYVASGTGTYTSTLIVNSSVTLAVTSSVFVTTGDDRIKTANIQGAGTLTCASITLGTNMTPGFDRTNTLNSTITNWTCSGTLTIYGNDNGSNEHRSTFSLQSGTLTVDGVSQTVEGDSDAILTTTGGGQSGTLILTGATPFTQSGSVTTTFTGTSATVSYQRSGTQTVLATSYRNLTIVNSGLKTTGGAFSVLGTLTVNSGATLAAGHTVTTSSTASINGTFQINSGGSISAAPTYGASSTLIYNSGGSYNRGTEWTTATSGAGYPANVQISNPGTTTTLNMLTTAAQCSGNLTLDASTAITTTSGGLTVLGNVTFNGSYTLGGDLYVRGNYTIGASPTVNNNSKAVFFTHATADQTVTRTGGGTVFFDYLVIDKATSGNVVIESATNIEINTATGNVLQLNNTGGLDLNGRKLTLNNSGGGIYVNGNRTITSGVSGGDITITNYKFVANNSGTGRLSIGQNVTVNLSTNGNIDFGSSGGAITTINGILSLNSTTSCFVNTNAPIYSSTSTLRYNSGGSYNRSAEWTTATSGAGYPYNVQISNNTTLNVNNSGNASRQLAGDLTVDAGSTFSMQDMTIGSPTVIGVTVVGNIINNGTVTLSTSTERLKCTNFTNSGTTTLSSNNGGDLELTGNLIDNGTFNASTRAVFFTGTGTQDVSGSGTFNIDYIVVNKSAGTVRMLNNLLCEGPNTGNAITLTNTTDILDLNGYTLTLGKASVNSTISGSGYIRGGSTSNLVINGTGAFGTINMDPATPGTTNQLASLTINRTTSGSVTLGNNIVLQSLVLTDGAFDISGRTLTLQTGSPLISRTSGTITTSSATNLVFGTAGNTGGNAFTFPTGVFTSAPTFTNVTINRTNSITLGSQDWTINGTLTLTSGVLNSGSVAVILGSAASVSGGSAGSHVRGNLRRVIPTGTNPSVSYAIGDGTVYAPVTLNITGTVSAATGTITISTTGIEHPNIGTSGINNSVSVNRYWTITNNVTVPGLTSYAAAFTYVSGDNDNTGEAANYVMRRYTGATWAATTLSGVPTSTGATATALTDFGDFAIGKITGTIAVSTQPTSASICSGANTSFVAASTSTPLPTVKWQRDAGSGFADITGVMDGGIYTGFATGTLTVNGATAAVTGYQYKAIFSNINGTVETDIVGLTVNNNLTPTSSLTITTGGGSADICVGSSVEFTTIAGNTGGGTVSYDFIINGASVVNSSSNTYTTSTLADGDVVRCDISITGGACLSSSTATSNTNSTTKTMNVDDPIVTIGASTGSTICNGTSVTYTTSVSNESQFGIFYFVKNAKILYTFKKNGTNVQSGYGKTYTTSVLSNGDQITCDITLEGGPCDASVFSSNTITMTVNAISTSVSLAASTGTTICSSTNVTFTATASNTGGGTVTYTFKRGATTLQTGASNTVATSSISNNDAFTCEISVSGGSCTASSATSNTLTMTVVNPSVTIGASPSGQVCSGTSVTITATPSGLGGGTVSNYNFKLNGGSDQSGASATYTTSSLANGDGVVCEITVSGGTCAGVTRTSNTFTADVTASFTPTVEISVAPGSTISLGGSVTFTATASNYGGVGTVSYNFKVNGASQQSGASNTYTTSALTNGNNVTCDITISGGSCLSSGTATSNTITMIVSSSSFVWTGLSSKVWTTASNWSGGVVPGASDNVILQTGSTRYPEISSGTVSINNLTIQSGASIIVSGTGTLQIAGTVSNSGTFTATNGTVEFNGSSLQTINGSLFANSTVSNLKISNNVTLSGTLNVTGTVSFGSVSNKTLSSGGYLVLKSRAAGTARVADLTNNTANTGNVISGDVIVERYIPAGRKWRGLCAPLTGSTNNSIFYNWQNNGTVIAGTGVLLWSSNGTGAAGNGMTLNSASGASSNILGFSTSAFTTISNTKTTDLFTSSGPIPYLVFVTDQYRISGGNQSFNSSATTLKASGSLINGSHTVGSLSSGYKMIANPYASPIEFSSIGKSNLVGNAFWVWDPKLEGFSGYGGYVYTANTGSGYISSPKGGTYSANSSLIPSGAAFWVEIQPGFIGSLTFNQTDKKSGGFELFGARTQESQVPEFNVNLRNSAGNLLYDGITAVYTATASADLDGNDLVKFAIGTENISARRGSKDLAIEFKPLNQQKDTIFLRLHNLVKDKTYRLELMGSNFDLSNGLTAVLQDLYDGNKEYSLNMQSTTSVAFTVNADAASAADRFRVVFRQSAVTSVTNRDNFKRIALYPNPVVKGTELQLSFSNQAAGRYQVKVYDLLGAQILNKSVQYGGGATVQYVPIPSNWASGIYIVELINEKGMIQKQKINVQ